MDYAYANELEIDSNGLLCGRTVTVIHGSLLSYYTLLIQVGPVVTPQRKRNLLVMLARVEGVRVDQVSVAMRDVHGDCHSFPPGDCSWRWC